MALATRCPHCKTTFRVANDQLKLRAGLVRCGACKEIFNGIEHLLRPDAVDKPAVVPPAAVAEKPLTVKPDADPEPVPAPEQDTRDIASFLALRPASTDASAEASQPDAVEQPQPHAAPASPASFAASYQSPQSPQSLTVDPLQRMTLVDFSYAEDEQEEAGAEEPQPQRKQEFQQEPDQPDPLDEAMEALQRKPLRGTKKSKRKHRPDADSDDDVEEPSFVTEARRRESFGRTLRLSMAIGSLVLLVTAAVQATHVFSNQLAAWLPDAKPALDRVCAMLACQVGLPTQIEAVSIESSELQALAPEKNIFSLTFLLRNHGATTQAWPHVEMTLNDANEQAIARRVFTPTEYLGARGVPANQQELTGFTAKSEQSFKLFFELSQIKASGYRVYVFYP